MENRRDLASALQPEFLTDALVSVKGMVPSA